MTVMRRVVMAAMLAALAAGQAVPALGEEPAIDAVTSAVSAPPAAAPTDWALSSVPGLYPVGELVPNASTSPRGIVIDPATGFVWTSDRDTSVVTVYDHSGDDVLTFGVNGNGSGQLSQPQGMAISGGEVYIAEEANHRVQVFDTLGNHLRMWGSLGALAGQFNEPCDVEVVDDFVYVADAENDRIQVFTPSGNFVDQFGSTGTGDGELSLSCTGSGLTYFNGEIFVADTTNHRIAVFDLQGNWERNFGSATLSNPLSVDADAKGVIWVVDAINNDVTLWGPTGAPMGSFGGTGSAIGAFLAPTGIVVDPTGAVAWVHEQSNARMQVFTKLKCNGLLLTHVGTSYPDNLTTGAADDVVHLLKGIDTASTKGGSDTVCGGPGGDTIRTGAGSDRVLGQGGNDIVYGGKGGDEIEGHGGADRIFGEAGKDTIRGGTGKDILKGGGNNDTIYGGTQNDTLVGNSGDDSLRGNAGNDVCKGGPGTDTAKGCETKIGIDLFSGRTLAVLPEGVQSAG